MLKHDLQNLEYQIDFPTSEDRDKDLMSWFMDNSTRVQHLLGESPRISRWWFKDFGTALDAAAKCSDQEGLTYRLICLATDAQYIQNGFSDNP